MDSSKLASLYSHYNHQIIYVIFDLKVSYPFLCHFSQTISDHIKRAVDLFGLELALENPSSVLFLLKSVSSYLAKTYYRLN